MLIVRGVNLFPTQVEELLQDFDLLTPNYQLIVSRTGTLDQVELQVEVEIKLSDAINGKPFDFEYVRRV